MATKNGKKRKGIVIAVDHCIRNSLGGIGTEQPTIKKTGRIFKRRYSMTMSEQMDIFKEADP